MIKTGDIFHAEYDNYYGTKKKHYFYCVYSQNEDINNTLNEDVIGLMITSNQKMDYIIENKNDYNVRIELYEKEVYVCCDKIFRFNKNEIDIKGDMLNQEEKDEILVFYKKFIKESLRQLGEPNMIVKEKYQEELEDKIVYYLKLKDNSELVVTKEEYMVNQVGEKLKLEGKVAYK